MGTRVQPSDGKQAVFEFFATPLLPEDVTLSALPEGMLTVGEVARVLRVSTATVYKLCAASQLPHVRVVNVIRIPAQALGQVMRAGAR